MADNGVIGREGALPWRLPEDLRHFRRVTMGHAIIMGRRTWESLGGPLRGRRNLVLTSRRGYVAEGAEVFPSLSEAVEAARSTDDEPFVIGGASVYAEALPMATRLVLTEVHDTPEGDTWFPAWDRDAWREVDRRSGDGCDFVTLAPVD